MKSSELNIAELFLDAAELDPSLAGPRYRLAQLALTDGCNDKALGLLKIEMKFDFEDPDVLNSIGTMFMKLGDFDDAMDCFLKVLDHDPMNEKAFYYMGKSLAMQGETEGAFHFFEYAMELGSEDIQLYKDAIRIYCQQGQLALAEKTVKDAKKISANDQDLEKLESRVRFAILLRKIKNAVKGCFFDKISLFMARGCNIPWHR